MMAPYRPISICRLPCVPLLYACVPGEEAVKVYVTVPPGAASWVSRPVTPPVAVTVKPGNKIEVLPAAVGRLLVSVMLTEAPSVTIIVGSGTCIVGQFWLGKVGAKPAGVPLHP